MKKRNKKAKKAKKVGKLLITSIVVNDSFLRVGDEYFELVPGKITRRGK